MNDLTFV